MIVCASCATELPDDARFCLRCGAAVAAQAAAPPASVAEERKTVTVLFCDLVAFTAMGEAADPEDVEAVLARYHETARREIERHGGVVEKFIGDAVVGVFGVPAVHEDDAERAVRAGLRVLESLEGMTRPDGAPLEARVGVDTGEALVRLDVDPASGRGFLTGDAVNTAARLQAAAPPMGVVAGAATQARTAQAIRYEALPAVAAKGKAEPVAAWRAVGRRSGTGLRTDGSAQGPFLGRAAELRALHEAAEEAWRVREAQVVLVVGEPGMGKSRLVLELSRDLESSTELITWRQGRCLAYGDGVAFWALGEVVKEHAGILDSDDVGTVEDKLEAVLPGGAERPWLRQRVRALLGLEAPQAEQGENFAAWTRFLEVMASGRPMVLVLEDLHWAGEGMLAFVEQLAAQVLRVPLLVVATTRPELAQRRRGFLRGGDGARRCTRIDLGALGPGASRRLIADLLEARHLSAPDRVTQLVGGNPLYAEQYARLLLEGGHVVRTVSGVQIRVDDELPVPATVQDVLAARLDALPGGLKSLLCDAAVVGESFWRGGVAALSGRDTAEVDRGMAALAERGLVRPAVSRSLEDEPEYLFWHALARDVAYGLLPRARRARRHLAAARWIEGRFGARLDDFSEIVVHHYVTALELARAAKDDEFAAELTAPTMRALLRAGERAVGLDLEAAGRYCARGLELAAADAPERPRLLQRRAQALWLQRHYREAAAAYREAIAGFEARGEVRAAAVAMCHLASVLPWVGEPSADITVAAVRSLEQDGPSAEKAEVLGLFALTLTLLDREPAEVIAAAAEAIAICGSLGLPEPAMALSCRGFARLGLGDAEGLEDCRRAIAAARAQGLGVERITIELNAADPTFRVEGARARLEYLEHDVDLTLTRGLDSYVVAYRGSLVGARVALGEWDDALREAEQLVEECAGHEELWDALVMRSMWALLLCWRGDGVRARSLVPRLLDEARRHEFPWTKGYALFAAASLCLADGDAEQAAALLAESAAASRSLASCPDDLAEIVRLALAAGRVDLARLVAEARAAMPARLLPLQEHAVTSVDALLAEADGELEAAAAGFADAARRWREFGVPYEEGQARFGLGRCLVALGRVPEAAASLAAAREIFAPLGAKPALAQTEEWLAQAAGA